MKKIWISMGIILAMILLVGGSIFIKNLRSSQVDGDDLYSVDVVVQKVIEQELTDSILVTGKIIPAGEQKVYVDPEKGEIAELAVKENDTVKKGQVLFSYDSSPIDTEFNQAVRQRDLMRKMVEIETGQIAELTKQIAHAKKEFEQQKHRKIDTDELDFEGIYEPFITQEDIFQLESEKVQLEMSHESTKAELQTLQQQINELDAQRKDLHVVSDINGMVVKINENIEMDESGAVEPMIHIISNEPFHVIGTMSEFDAVKVEPGQKVIIHPKVYKDREWEGVVKSVSPFPTEDNSMDDFYYDGMGGGNVTLYPFTVEIKGDTSDLRQGFHVSLEVKLGESEKKKVIPHMAILDDDFGEAYVFVLVDGKLERRVVETGDMSDEFIEILEGVELDEFVVIYPDEEMYDGMEVDSYDEIDEYF